MSLSCYAFGFELVFVLPRCRVQTVHIAGAIGRESSRGRTSAFCMCASTLQGGAGSGRCRGVIHHNLRCEGVIVTDRKMDRGVEELSAQYGGVPECVAL